MTKKSANSDFDYKSALCAQTDPELFFPQTWQSSTQIQQAKSICKVCPVKAECLAEALREEYNDGIWGGLTPAERSRLMGAGDVRWRSNRRRLPIKLGETNVIRITKENQ